MEDIIRIEELENILLEDTKPYAEKLDAVVTIWKFYYEQANDQECPDILNQVLPLLYRAAVRIILHGDWPRLKHVTRRKFTSLIKRCNQYLCRKFPENAKKCKTLTFLWVDPWDHPTLRLILEKANAPDEDVCGLINHEGGELLFLRLEAMCEGKCEDLALQLAACYLKHLKQSNGCHDIDVDDMNDIFIALLYKYKKQEVVDMLKAMPLTDGIKLITRFSEKAKNKGRLWRHFDKMKHIACHTLLDMTMDIRMDLEEDRQSLSDLLEVWINLNIAPKMAMDDPLKQVSELARTLIGTAGSARHIYIFTQVLNHKYGGRVKLLCVELYIRGLTLNLNEIEELKALGDEKLIHANKDLADGFLQLAELFSGNESVCRECILSSFSLFPTKETLNRIQTLLQVEDGSKHPEACADARRLEKCSYHSQYNCTCCHNFLSIQLDPDILKSAPHLPDDLATVICRSRSKALTWSLGRNLDWECQKYLKNYKGPEVKTQQLQYLNIDYSKFNDWPKPRVEPSKLSKMNEGQPSKAKIRKVSNINSKALCIGKADAVKSKLKAETMTDTRNRWRRKSNLNHSPSTSKINSPRAVILHENVAVPNHPSTFIDDAYQFDNQFPQEDDGSYSNEVEFIMKSKPSTHSVGTFVSIPRFKKEAGTQTEPECLMPCQAANVSGGCSSVTLDNLMKPNSIQPTESKSNDPKPSESSRPKIVIHPIPGSSAKCTTPVSSLEFNKPVRTYFNRKTANLNNNTSFNSYANTHSPKPAEVPPTASSDIRIQEKLKPILKSLDMNPKVVLEDIMSLTRVSTQLPRELEEKAGFPYPRENLDILAQAVMRSDILLAKSVPGMNSVDMIVPQPQETTVHVVQISNSTPVLSQPAVTTVSASPSISHSIHTSGSSNTANIMHSINPSSLSRLKSSDTSFQTDCSTSSHIPEMNKTHDTNNFVAATVDSSASTLMIPTSSNAETRMNSMQMHSGNPQLPTGRSPMKNNSTTTEPLSLTSEVPCTSQQEGSLITAHIQRVGQPSKQRNSEMAARINSMNQVSSNDESNKVSSSQVFRLIVKDGRVVEQYYQGNQSLEPVLSIPDSEETETLPNVSNSYNHDHFIKLLKKKNDMKTKQVTRSVDQVSSLPKFHHVFGRQMYQSDAMSLESSSMSSHTQYEERSNNADVKGQGDVISTGLSKGVQTALKDTDPPNKTVEKQRVEVQTHLTTAVLPPSSSASVATDTKDVRHGADLPTSSGVIFTCKVPISISNNSMLQGKPVTILKTSSTSADSIPCTKVVDNENRSKDSVIRSSNMNALLAAALQSSSPIKHTVISTPSSTSVAVGSVKHIKVNNAEGIMMQKIRMPTPVQKNIRRQATQPSRYIRPMLQVSTGTSMTQTGPPVVTIPLPARTVVLATNVTQNTLQSNLSKMESRPDHMNSDQPSVSSTTLEQLREFESVLEQVTNTSQMKERGNAKKVEHQPTQTTSTDFSAAASKVNPIFQSSLVSTISELNNESVSLTFINKNVSSSSSTMVTTNPSKIAATTPVVVVQSCSRPLASPALSITSQSSLSPAPQTSPAHVQNKIGAKVAKPKVKTSIGKTAPTTTIKVSTLPKPQQKPQEDEQTTQRIYAILDKYAEQLRNSPELKNKPAPRRRSNPPTNPTQSSKRKKSSQNKSKSVSSLPACSGSEMSPGSEDLRTLGSEDSSNGVSQLSQVLNSPQSRNDEHSNPAGGDVSSETSESLDSKDQRSQHRILLTEPSSSSSRAVLVQENMQPLINVDGPKVLAGKQLVVGSGATVPLTLSLPAGNVKQVIFPVPADGRPFVVAKVPKMYRVHQVTMPTGSPLLATAGSGAVVLRQMCLNKGNSGVKQVKLPVVSQLPTQGLSNISSQPAVVLPSGSQSFTLATSSSLDGDSLGITLDNTILLNTSTSQSLGFFQRNVTKSVGSQQSPNLLVQTTRASHESDNMGQFSGTPDLASSAKCENTLPNHLVTTVTDDQNKTSNPSSQNASSFKNDEMRYNLTSEMAEKQPLDTSEMMNSNSKNWTQLLEDSKGDDVKKEDKIVDSDLKNTKTEFHNISRSESLVEPSAIKSEDPSSKSSSQNDSVIKSKMKDEPHQFSEGRVLQDGVKTCLTLQQDSSDQWQFNLSKVERSTKDMKIETSSQETVKANSGLLLNNINHNIGVKRKLNVENTIFQVAFKRSDKLKLVKDEFIHQRNSNNTLEREIRLQKSLSEECEDLGVDKPRTSELFPEAELLLDSDPLSRDSLQELYSRGMESSSSSHDSPSRSSPTVLSDNSHSKFSSLSWKKQKNVLKTKSIDSNSEKLLKLERLENKSESSCESSTLNGSTEPSNSAMSSDMKSQNNDQLSLKPNAGSLGKDNSIASSSRDDIASPDSDNCNFSEADDSCGIGPDLMDTDGESDSDSRSNTCKAAEYGDIVEPINENERRDKTNDFRITTGQKCNNCTYQTNKEESFKEKLDTNLQWFNIDQESSNKVSPNASVNDDSSNKMSREESTNDNSLNGILLDDWHSHRDCSLAERHLKRSLSGSSTFYRELNSPKTKRKKTPSIYVSSAGEDSCSSMDTLLTAGSDDSEMHRLARRTPSRGRVKKGCPCFNGASDHCKKKKDLSSGPFVKTDKPCVSKSVNFHMSQCKKSQKLVIKNPVKKR